MFRDSVIAALIGSGIFFLLFGIIVLLLILIFTLTHKKRISYTPSCVQKSKEMSIKYSVPQLRLNSIMPEKTCRADLCLDSFRGSISRLQGRKQRKVPQETKEDAINSVSELVSRRRVYEEGIELPEVTRFDERFFQTDVLDTR